MAFTTADVDTLKAAIATGALQVRYADGSGVTYRSQAELERALARAEAEVASTAGGSPRSRSFVASS